MATKTLGTAATTTLTAIQVPSPYAGTALLAADIATLRNLILDDCIGVAGNLFTPPGSQATAKRIWPGALDEDIGSSMLLNVPNRGTLRVYPGDWIAVDPNTGAVILLPSATVAGTATATGTTANGSFNVTFATSVLAIGWAVNMPISETNIPANSSISAISADGKTVTFTNAAGTAATGSAANTATVGNWVHS